MRKSVLASTAVGALILSASMAVPAYASGGESDGGDIDVCTDNSCKASIGNVSGGNVGNITNTNTAHGGEGGYATGGTGYGGDGGTGYGGDVDNHNYNDSHNKAYGGDAEVKNYNQDYNKNENKNYNQDYNKNENKNYNQDYNKNENKNYNKNDNYNRNSNKQGQAQGQAQGQQQGQHQSVQNSGNSSVNIENERPPVNTAYSAALATSEDTCMGSSSIGGQAVSFGLTIGTTWTDDNCQRLKNSRQLVALGYHRAATSLICFDESVAEAMNRAGTPCPSGAVAVYVAPPPVYVPSPAYVPMRPIVDDRPVKRKRKKVLPPK